MMLGRICCVMGISSLFTLLGLWDYRGLSPVEHGFKDGVELDDTSGAACFGQGLGVGIAENHNLGFDVRLKGL